MAVVKKAYSTKDLIGTRVVGGKNGTKHIGKVRRFVFHPSEKRVVGFIVKRPDAAMMFHRKDLFVALDSLVWEDGHILLPAGYKSNTGEVVCKRLGIDWDRCTLWEGMPLVTISGETCGLVGNVTFLCDSGEVVSCTIDRGTMNRALLGSTDIPAAYIRGFNMGIGGAALNVHAERNAKDGKDGKDAILTGAILVSDEVRTLACEGGLAQKAGEGAAKAQYRYHEAKTRAKPKIEEAVKVTGEAVNKGSYTIGRRIGRSKGMFKAFKEEYDKAVSDD